MVTLCVTKDFFIYNTQCGWLSFSNNHNCIIILIKHNLQQMFCHYRPDTVRIYYTYIHYGALDG